MKKLFDVSQVTVPDLKAKVASSAFNDEVSDQFLVAGTPSLMVQQQIGVVAPGSIVHFWSNGDWSLYQLVEHLLNQTGPGTEVYLATWSISELSARKLTSWIDTGLISNLVGVIDYRSKNRHPAAFHLSKQAFSKIRIAYCHAKVTVLSGGGHCITINGSANWTENPRLESGIITNSELSGRQNIELIRQIVDNGEYTID